jgi:hypothetical protein
VHAGDYLSRAGRAAGRHRGGRCGSREKPKGAVGIIRGEPVTQTVDYSHRTTVQKLGIRPDQRVEVAGDLGVDLRRELREVLGRGFVRSAELDAAVVLVESLADGQAAMATYRPRMRDNGCLWLVTWKRGHEGYLNQLSLVAPARRLGLIDNKTCSIDDERSGIRFVIPRALRGEDGQSMAAELEETT